MVLACALLSGLAACGTDHSERDAMLALVDHQDWEEIRARAQVLREAGASGAWLDYSEGLSSLHLGGEQNARRLLAAAVQADSTLAPEAAKAWSTLALADYEAGWRDRARERMAEAVLMDPSTDPGPLLPAVADYLFRFVKKYDEVRPLYRRLYEERPEPESRHPEWVYRWGHLIEMQGDLPGARAVYEEFLKTFPDDRDQGRYVRWRYMHVLLLQAEDARSRGDLQGAVDLCMLIRAGEWHLDQQERAEYMMGQISEQQGELELARDHYERVVAYSEKFMSEAVEPAKARLEALDAIGVH